jgi:putative addiction module CopG family antidote
MATQRTTVNISLTPELDAFLQSRVKSGRYQTTSEVVREALRLLHVTSKSGMKHFASLQQNWREARSKRNAVSF